MRYNAMLKEARMIAPQTEEQTSGGQYGHLSIHISDHSTEEERKKKTYPEPAAITRWESRYIKTLYTEIYMQYQYFK